LVLTEYFTFLNVSWAGALVALAARRCKEVALLSFADGLPKFDIDVDVDGWASKSTEATAAGAVAVIAMAAAWTSRNIR